MKNFSVKLVSTTKTEIEFIQSFIENDEFKEIISTPEGLMVYAARVSSPNQENPKYANLLKYCLKNGHWSVFEMCDMMVEIETSRALAAQILRHKTFNFQEFSQRYQALTEEGICIYEARRQDQKNRQNSIDDISIEDKEWFVNSQKEVWEFCFKKYEQALEKGIAKECARFLLPLNTKTRLYMKGSVRSWIHYIDVRSANGTQKEHQDIALGAKKIFIKKFPIISEAREWI